MLSLLPPNIIDDSLLRIREVLRRNIYRIVTGIRFCDPNRVISRDITTLSGGAKSTLLLRSIQDAGSAWTWKSGHVVSKTEAIYSYRVEQSEVIIGRNCLLHLEERKLLDLGGQARLDVRNLNDLAADRFFAPSTVVMAWPLGRASYGDFLLQVLPRVVRLSSHLEKNERRKATIMLNYFPQITWAMEYLDLLGFDRQQIVSSDKRAVRVRQGERIIFGSGPANGSFMADPSNIALLRKELESAFPTEPVSTRRRLYISRKGTRVLLNESELLPGLLSRSFEIISLESMSVLQQARLFREAEIIVGSHGAGHANILWCRQGAVLIEVMSREWMHPSYKALAQLLNIKYRFILSLPRGIKPHWNSWSYHGISKNTRVDPDVFFRAIDKEINSD